MGVQVVAKDHREVFQAALSERLYGLLDPFHVELLALQKSISLAVSLGFRDVVFEGDSLQVIKLVKHRGGEFSRYGVLLEDIMLDLAGFQSWDLSWVQRKGNGVAYTLAKNGLHSLQQQIWNIYPPVFVLETLSLDVESV
ncbi:hypothetical protein ACH5RR_013045 [Cinchona calisaya]|uniref:RNase H type-1 domain-containing protein n=1 Tax=Cinchona calisaya TaxID=153742 RepID=A0ABD3A4N2_9GENT